MNYIQTYEAWKNHTFNLSGDIDIINKIGVDPSEIQDLLIKFEKEYDINILPIRFQCKKDGSPITNFSILRLIKEKPTGLEACIEIGVHRLKNWEMGGSGTLHSRINKGVGYLVSFYPDISKDIIYNPKYFLRNRKLKELLSQISKSEFKNVYGLGIKHIKYDDNNMDYLLIYKIYK